MCFFFNFQFLLCFIILASPRVRGIWPYVVVSKAFDTIVIYELIKFLNKEINKKIVCRLVQL